MPLSKAQEGRYDFSDTQLIEDAGSTLVGISQHIGFDKCAVLDPSAVMSVWWTNSPYFDVGFYLPGGLSLPCDVSDMNADWIDNISTQGWGLIPIWSGLQAPCSGKLAKFDWNPSTARSEGYSEALTALNSAASVGLTYGNAVSGYTPTMIYDDLEQYEPTDLDSTDTYSCGDAVAAFVDGWVSAMYSEQQPVAGVYASPKDAKTWLSYSNISHLPDDVWLTGTNNNVTVWGLHGNQLSLSDNLWSGNQRIHQYHLDRNDLPTTNEVWGGVSETVDRDIGDATIIAGEGVEKSYTYTTQTIDYPGSSNTEPSAINNSVNSNISQYIGVVVGSYFDGAKWHGFLTANGTYLPIDCAGANSTFAHGISDPTFQNAGYIVGWYDMLSDDGESVIYHGFEYDILNQSCTNIDVPFEGATSTSPSGINDAGWITGSYTDSSYNYHGFLYKNGVYSSFDYPGG
jgi:hypothetical protein